MKLVTYLCGKHAKTFKDKMETDALDLPRFCGEYDCHDKPTFEVVIQV